MGERDTTVLGQRIATAIVLLAILVPTLLTAAPIPFIALTLLLIAAAAWEWAHLNGVTGLGALATGLLCGLLCAAMWWGGAHALALGSLWIGVALCWVAGGGWLLARGVTGWPKVPRLARWAIGVAMLCVAWLALAQARLAGVNFVLSVLGLVWMADVCAYFTGRRLGGRLTGGRKLAPTISPGKSWEGVAGGMLGVLLLALWWVWLDRGQSGGVASLYTRLLQHGPVWLVLGTLFLAGMSVVGDLMESLVKRSAGVKDSSRLLPGHGGVLDRIDALLPTLPLALAVLALAQGMSA